MKWLLKIFKACVRWCVCTWPYGYLCDFEWGSQGRIRLTKGLWIIVGDEKTGATDALPINFCSEQLIDRVVEDLNSRWYAPTQKEQS